MSSGNRVEELENRVRELEATVSGLTDELVETKERLRALEEEVDPDVESGGDIIAPEPSTGMNAGTDTPEPEADGGAEAAKGTQGEEGDNADSESESELGDDIIVA